VPPLSIVFALAASLLGGPPPADIEAEDQAPPPAVAEPAPAEETDAEVDEEKEWEFSLALSGYVVRDDSDYLALTFTADRDWLHLEGRFNYEDLDTFSAFIGYNISKGETFTFDLTPIIGGVVGNTDAIAPGYELTLGYKWFELYTEGEFVFDLNSSDDDYFYSWSELTVSPVDWFYFGLVAQRTKARDMDREIEWGPMAGFSAGRVDFSTYFFQPGGDDQTIAASLTIHF